MRIIKGYWTCKYCNSKDLDGLIDNCPNCGKRKSDDVKYYLNKNKIEVSEEELNNAGIDITECDGEHKEWVCSYCNQLNNYADENCAACGASKLYSEFEYGEVEKQEVKSTNNNDNNEEYTNNLLLFVLSHIKDFFVNHIHIIGGIAGALVFIALIAFLLWPIKSEVTITDFSWERTITIEEERTVKESDWYVPSGGRVYDSNWEFKEYKTVLDHYETVYETKTRQVFSHYETYYTYRDNGNGTFTEVPHQKPVYKTETYVETREEPVYRQDPVYATKYYYEIERWFEVRDYTTRGNDQLPYWETAYSLAENERDILTNETYTVWYSNDLCEQLSLSEWSSYSIGDGFEITTCRVGIIYKKEQIN